MGDAKLVLSSIENIIALTQAIYIDINEPRCEKTGYLLNAKTKTQISCAANQHLCFRYTDSKIPLLAKSGNSSL